MARVTANRALLVEVGARIHALGPFALAPALMAAGGRRESRAGNAHLALSASDDWIGLGRACKVPMRRRIYTRPIFVIVARAGTRRHYRRRAAAAARAVFPRFCAFIEIHARMIGRPIGLLRSGAFYRGIGVTFALGHLTAPSNLLAISSFHQLFSFSSANSSSLMLKVHDLQLSRIHDRLTRTTKLPLIGNEMLVRSVC